MVHQWINNQMSIFLSDIIDCTTAGGTTLDKRLGIWTNESLFVLIYIIHEVKILFVSADTTNTNSASKTQD